MQRAIYQYSGQFLERDYKLYRARIINKVELNASQGWSWHWFNYPQWLKVLDNKPLGHIKTVRTIATWYLWFKKRWTRLRMAGTSSTTRILRTVSTILTKIVIAQPPPTHKNKISETLCRQVLQSLNTIISFFHFERWNPHSLVDFIEEEAFCLKFTIWNCL